MSPPTPTPTPTPRVSSSSSSSSFLSPFPSPADISADQIRLLDGKYDALLARLYPDPDPDPDPGPASAAARTTTTKKITRRAPTKLAKSLIGLDAWRYAEMPAVVDERKGRGGRRTTGGGKGGEKGNAEGKGGGGGEGGGAAGWLELDEVRRLVDWKITRGKSRPFLPGMVASNPAELVQSTTQAAFALYQSSSSSSSSSSGIDTDTAVAATSTATTAAALSALDKLCVLRGIGPATAALLLNVAFPAQIPFFSDELFAWVVAGTVEASSSTTGKIGKAASLKYSKKEYAELLKAVDTLRERLNGVGSDGDGGGGSSSGSVVTAQQIERASWVIETLRKVGEPEASVVWGSLGDGGGDGKKVGDGGDAAGKVKKEDDDDGESGPKIANAAIYGAQSMEEATDREMAAGSEAGMDQARNTRTQKAGRKKKRRKGNADDDNGDGDGKTPDTQGNGRRKTKRTRK